MKSPRPLVSVLMSVYNGQRFLRGAIDSILAQTLSQLEFIIVDDGSTDATCEILNSYADRRIIRVQNQHNIGLPQSLNKGLSLAIGEYIARMDADDLSMPTRLEQQASFLDATPEVGVVGASIQFIDEAGRPTRKWSCPRGPMATKWQLLFNSPLAHPAAMMRRVVIDELPGDHVYDPDPAVRQAEDYDLWARLSAITAIANLGDTLLYYRTHGEQLSRCQRLNQVESTTTISQRLISDFLGTAISPELVVSMVHPTRGSLLARQSQRLLRRLYRKFLSLYSLTCQEKREVDSDFCRRAFDIARTSYADVLQWPYLIRACMSHGDNASRLLRDLGILIPA